MVPGFGYLLVTRRPSRAYGHCDKIKEAKADSASSVRCALCGFEMKGWRLFIGRKRVPEMGRVRIPKVVR
jgi:hypothetical protein